MKSRKDIYLDFLEINRAAEDAREEFLHMIKTCLSDRRGCEPEDIAIYDIKASINCVTVKFDVNGDGTGWFGACVDDIFL